MPKASSVVSSFNGWDPLEEVIVGSVDNGARPAFEPAMRPYFPNPEDREFKVARRGDDELALASDQLETLAEVLRQEGASSTCPRDVLLVVGDEIIEASMAMRCRFFEYLPYRSLVTQYFNSGARWTAAPKPSMSDEMYVGDFTADGGGFDADTNPALSDAEPCFDAASFARCGRDIFYQPDIVTNDFGAHWLGRQLGPEYRLHRARFADAHPQHIDATMVPLRAGLVMMNPDRPPIDDTIALFEENDWEVVWAPPAVRGNFSVTTEVSNWVSMNVFNVNEDTIICEEREKPMIEFLKSFGFRVIAIPFANVYPFGGSFHCCTLDIRRTGILQSYFPNLDAQR
jgi:glycine amidinotransferase